MYVSDQIRKRVETYPWAGQTVDKLHKDLGPFLEAGWIIPDVYPASRWSLEYQCSTCSTGLAWTVASPHSHTCPNCGNVETDDNFREAWITLLNLNQITAANTMIVLAKAGRLADGYSLAKACLMGYAERYPEYMEHGKQAGVGKLQPQSLDEAVWMLQATRVYEELTAAKMLSPEERELVRVHMFTPAIRLLKRQTSGVHNIQSWKASAIASMSLATGDESSFAFGRKIVLKNAREGVLPNGLWYEISPGYHYYALEALFSYEQSLRHYGRTSGIEDTLRSMLEAPLSFVMGNGKFPAINDSSSSSITRYAALYEMGEGLLGGFGSTLALLCRETGYERDTPEALLYGPDDVDAEPRILDPLTITQGMVAMRREKAEILFKCTPPAGGHDHPDRLTLNLLFPGSALKAVDLGAVGYSNPIHGGLLKRTESHNTVMVDGQQWPIVDTQRISKSYDLGDALVVTGHYNQAFPGLLFWRKIVLGNGWCLDWTSCESDEDHLYQWIFHVNAPIHDEEGTPLVKDEGQQMLIDNPYLNGQRIVAKDRFRGSWIHETGDVLNVVSQLQEDSPGEAGVFESPDLPTNLSRNALLMQSKAKCFELITLFSLNDTPLPSYTLKNDALEIRINETRFALLHRGYCEPIDPTFLQV